MTDPFPHDIKTLIASFLKGHQVRRLVLVNHAWKEAGEPYLLSRLRVPPGYYHMIDGQEEAASWAGLRQLLESQPARVSCIRKMTVFTIPRAVEDTIAILRLVSPYVVTWNDVSDCMDHSLSTHCAEATLSHLSRAMLPLPALENLMIHLDGNWVLTLPGVLRMAPKLKSLFIHGCVTDLIPMVDSELWPRLDNLETLSVSTSLQGLESALIRTILSRCNNVKRFNLKLTPSNPADEAALVAHLSPIIATIGLTSVHLDIPWVDGRASSWFNGILHDYTDGVYSTTPIKEFSCTYPEISLSAAPWTRSVETFRILTTHHDPDFADEEDFWDSSLGFLPSRTTTGGIGFDVLAYLEHAPSLTLFQAGCIPNGIPFPPSDEGLQSLNIQTFVDGKRKLVHCWTNAKCDLFQFGRHDFTYRLSSRAGAWRHGWIDDPCLSDDGSIEHGYDFSPYNKPVLVDTFGSGSTVPGPYEFTHYKGSSYRKKIDRGWHLPLVVLDYVYSQVEYERMPSRGRIGLKLPPHVWQVLDDWYEGVQSLLVDSLEARNRSSYGFRAVESQSSDSSGSLCPTPTSSSFLSGSSSSLSGDEQDA